MTNSTTLSHSGTRTSHPRALWWRRFKIKVWHWEYWPVYIFNIPVVFTWLWHALRSCDLFFFTLTNPGIETGGFFGESKSAILHHIPEEYKPITVLLKTPLDEKNVDEILTRSGLGFPLIAKPEVGERGWHITKINNIEELRMYLREHSFDIILQTYVDFPMELSIMVYRTPDGREARVTSICEKHFLSVEGDGFSTIEQLLLRNDRALFQMDRLKQKFGDKFFHVLEIGQRVLLEPIGNHCRGTMFLNRNHEIDDAIKVQMLKLLDSMPGVFYGRFDMRVLSWESLRHGNDIRVLEFNGTSSDPAHIYQPGYSLLQAYKDIFYHWGVMFRIAKQNKKAGIKPVSFKKIISALNLYIRYKRTN